MSPDRVSIVVPAAGMSRRFGAEDKLAMPWGDSTVLGAVVSASRSLGPLEVIVAGRKAPDTTHVPVSNGAAGMSASIAAAIRAASKDAAGFLIWPADMPALPPAAARAVIERGTEGDAVRPRFEGLPGHPVFFGRDYRTRLESLQAGPGARSLLTHVTWLDWDHPGVAADIDTREDYQRLRDRYA